VAEPVGAEVEREARSTSKSAVSRAFVGRTRRALDELLSRGLSELELAVVMIDGIQLAGLTHVVALGITQDGIKVPLSLREGSTENDTVATVLSATSCAGATPTCVCAGPPRAWPGRNAAPGRVKGHRDPPKLVAAIAREPNSTEEVTTVLAA
jgi:hypothetical protein